jgi:cobalt-zinc-cadmium resistance protein CzcA
MITKLVRWALDNPLVVILLAVALAAVGIFAFIKINVEAYPDPSPPLFEIVAQYPGAAAEEVERQITIPLEVGLANMPGLQYTRSKTPFALSYLACQFEYGTDYDKCRQEVINRLSQVQLPQSIQPAISPRTPTGEIYRYLLTSPRDAAGRAIYSLNDIKAVQDWVLQREFRRIPRIADVTGFGGTVKRYEVHPDPERLKQFGITLTQLQNAIAASNANVGGDYLRQGPTVQVVRNLGLIGQGQDPVQSAIALKDPLVANRLLRREEQRRLQEIRQIVLASINNVPVCVEDVIEGGPLHPGEEVGTKGLTVGWQTRLGKVAMSQPQKDEQGRVLVDEKDRTIWTDDDDVVQGIVLLRKNEDSLPALRDVEAKVKELNENAGRMLPGVKIETYYDRTDLIGITTETVRENLTLGMVLVTLILVMFLSNVRSALIVAINIPLALLFAFAVLFFRGKSANLLSIGAVDFGIIVDSSVIIVENIYRHLSSGDGAELPLKDRILRAAGEVQRPLFFSTAVMVCAFIPLFTMQGPEGQIFGPMAETYAFALGGALVLAVLVCPALCLLFFRNLKPAPDNFLVRLLKGRYLRQLEICLNRRWATLGVFGTLIVGTMAFVVPQLGREFMPELEEGNLWLRATFPNNIALEEVSERVKQARAIIRGFPEVEAVVSQIGRPDDGTDPCSFYNDEFFVPLRPQKQWPAVKQETGWASLFHSTRHRTKRELIEEMNAELTRTLIGVDWNFSQNIRDNVMEVMSGIKGENCVKIFGPDLDRLEELAERVRNALAQVRGMEDVGVFRVKGQASLEFPVDREKCKTWGVNVADVQNVVQTAVGGKAFTQMIEGERSFDITLRWPEKLRNNETAILDIPVDVVNNTVTPGSVPSVQPTPLTGGSSGLSSTGSSLAMPNLTGSLFNATHNNLSNLPQRTLADLVTPLSKDGRLDPKSSFVRPGAAIIYREQGKRMIAVKFSVRGRDLAGAVAEAQEKTAGLFTPPYRVEWGGEFQEMKEAENRLLFIIPLSLGLIFILLYMAFHSLLDALLVLSNVADLSVGGVWALWLTGTHFNVAAAVGFVSIFGVAIMDGMLLVSYFNQLRSQGVPLRDAIIEGTSKRVRPVMMTAMTAILGLLPAALSTRIGAQTQQPLAIVVVGGMVTTLFLTRYLMPVLYSFYGHRQPATQASGLAH